MPAENKLAALVEQGCPVFYFYCWPAAPARR